MSTAQVNFCIRCGTQLNKEIRFGKPRPVCPACGWVYFADPKVAAAALVIQDGQVLLVRRVMAPAQGKWTLPGGFVDAGEDPAEAVVRECREETNLEVRVTVLLDVVAGQEHPRGAHILLLYWGEVIGGEIKPGDDVDRAAFFSSREIPPLAFQATERAIQLWQQGEIRTA